MCLSFYQKSFLHHFAIIFPWKGRGPSFEKKKFESPSPKCASLSFFKFDQVALEKILNQNVVNIFSLLSPLEKGFPVI